MSALFIAARIIHVLCGIFWVGAMLAFAGFIEPTIRALGPGGGPFMQHLVDRRRFPVFMTLAGALAILSGAFLMWRSSDGFDSSWMASPMGMTYSLGAVLGLFAFAHGLMVNKPLALRFDAEIREMRAAGGPPSPERLARIQGLQRRLRHALAAGAGMLVLAASAMAVARYL